MSSGYETILEDHVLARLTAGPALVADTTNIRRAHRTLIPELEPNGSPGDFAVHVIDGSDEPKRGTGRKCGARQGTFTVSLFARSDMGPTVLDDLKCEVNGRLDPEVGSYPAGVALKQGPIRVETDDANEDAVRIDMEYDLEYPTVSEWSLELYTG